MKIINLLMKLVSLFFSSSCTIYHHYPQMYGKIADAETEKPLEGPVVLAAYWTSLWGQSRLAGRLLF